MIFEYLALLSRCGRWNLTPPFCMQEVLPRRLRNAAHLSCSKDEYVRIRTETEFSNYLAASSHSRLRQPQCNPGCTNVRWVRHLRPEAAGNGSHGHLSQGCHNRDALRRWSCKSFANPARDESISHLTTLLELPINRFSDIACCTDAQLPNSVRAISVP